MKSAGVLNLLLLLTSGISHFQSTINEKKLEDFARTRHVKHTSNVEEPSNPIQTLVELVDAEGIKNEEL